MVYQVGDLTVFDRDDPTYGDKDAAIEYAITLSACDRPIGVWDMTDNRGELVAIVYQDAVFTP